MGINLNESDKQKAPDGIIPVGTILPVKFDVRGRKETKEPGGEYLDIEFTVVGGEYERRKIWENWMCTSSGTDGHNQAVEITGQRARAAWESAFGIDPDDDSDDAVNARMIDDWEDLDGITALIKVGIEKNKDPQYPDRNKISYFLTPSHDDYHEAINEDLFEPADVSNRAKPVKKGAAPKATGKAPAKVAGVAPAAKAAGAAPKWGGKK